MKNIFCYLIILLMIVSSCNNAELEQLKKENEELKIVAQQRETEIGNFMQVFNEIEENLSQIRMKEQLIVRRSNSLETGKNKIDAVKNDISAIDELMKKNRKNINNLSEKLKSSRHENKELEKMVMNFQKIINEKDSEIVTLVSKLDELNFEVEGLYTSVADLKKENIEKKQIIKTQEKELHKAFYITGTEKELKEKGIITKAGGFIGIGRVKKLNQDFDKKLFTEIDIREKKIFPVDTKKIKLLMPHPSDSYIIRKNDKKIYFSFEITRPEEFWKASKYMVLVTD